MLSQPYIIVPGWNTVVKKRIDEHDCVSLFLRTRQNLQRGPGDISFSCFSFQGVVVVGGGEYKSMI